MTSTGDQHESGHADTGLSFAIYQKLRDRIIKHVILPGQRLDVRRLAEDFGVSQGPVRDAVNRLTGEALVQHLSSRGYFVRPISAADLIEAYEMIFVVSRHGLLAARRPFEITGLQQRPVLQTTTGADVSPETEEVAKQYTLFLETLFERVAALSGNVTTVAVTRYFLDKTHYARGRNLLDSDHAEAVDRLIEPLLQDLINGAHQSALSTLERLLEVKLPRLPDLVAKIEAQILATDPLFQIRNAE